MKCFSEYIKEQSEKSKSVVFTFGRFNPPTIGHEKLVDKVASLADGNNYRIYASQSSDPKKNPLIYEQKIKFMRKMFPKHGRNIVLSKTAKTALHACAELYDQGYTEVTMVAGSDRVQEFESLLNKYNGVEGRHGLYNFEGGVNILSAGERDPDAEGVTGMSASKMRAAAEENNFELFSKGLPKGFKEAKQLFNAVRAGMGLKESNDFRSHIQLQPVSETREQYVSGSLFEEGDSVLINKTNEAATIVKLGANYVLVETANGERQRKWLDDIEKVDVKEFLKQKVESFLEEKAQLSGFDLRDLKVMYNNAIKEWKNFGDSSITPSNYAMQKINKVIR